MNVGPSNQIDRHILSDTLLTQKSVAKYYDDSLLESGTPEVRANLRRIHDEHVDAAHHVWQIMHHKGWYNARSASPEQITTILSSFSGQSSGQHGGATTSMNPYQYGNPNVPLHNFGGQGQQYGTQQYGHQYEGQQGQLGGQQITSQQYGVGPTYSAGIPGQSFGVQQGQQYGGPGQFTGQPYYGGPGPFTGQPYYGGSGQFTGQPFGGQQYGVGYGQGYSTVGQQTSGRQYQGANIGGGFYGGGLQGTTNPGRPTGYQPVGYTGIGGGYQLAGQTGVGESYRSPGYSVGQFSPSAGTYGYGVGGTQFGTNVGQGPTGPISSRLLGGSDVGRAGVSGGAGGMTQYGSQGYSPTGGQRFY